MRDYNLRSWEILFDLIENKIYFDEVKLGEVCADIETLHDPLWEIVISYWTADTRLLEIIMFETSTVKISLPGHLFPPGMFEHIIEFTSIEGYSNLSLKLENGSTSRWIFTLELLYEFLMIPKINSCGIEYPAGLDQETDLCVSAMREELYKGQHEFTDPSDSNTGLTFSNCDGMRISRLFENKINLDNSIIKRSLARMKFLDPTQRDIIMEYYSESPTIVGGRNEKENIHVNVPGHMFPDNKTRGVKLTRSWNLYTTLEFFDGPATTRMAGLSIYETVFILPSDHPSDLSQNAQICLVFLRDRLYRPAP